MLYAPPPGKMLLLEQNFKISKLNFAFWTPPGQTGAQAEAPSDAKCLDARLPGGGWGEAKLILEFLKLCLRRSIAAQGGVESKINFGNFEIVPQEAPPGAKFQNFQN